jgi:hypothetical protein
MLVTIIGRGHSGTRAISHTLTASGFHMGGQLNESGDLIPANDLYEACRVMGRHVDYLGGNKWDFSRLHTMPIDPEFTRLVESYLASVFSSDVGNKGWKLPDTTLIFPWIVRMFPDIRYFYWIRDPRDCILGGHVTDDLARFNIPYEATDNERLRRAISWKYQSDIFKATPQPGHMLTVRFEDFVLEQAATLARIEAFLGVPMAAIPVRPESVGRWRNDTGEHDFGIFHDEMAQYGYHRER